MNLSLPDNLRHELIDLITKGDEAAARSFVLAHFKEFPEATQDALITGLVEEALSQKQEGETLLAAFRAEGLEAAATLQKAKHDLELAGKAADLKESA